MAGSRTMEATKREQLDEKMAECCRKRRKTRRGKKKRFRASDLDIGTPLELTNDWCETVTMIPTSSSKGAKFSKNRNLLRPYSPKAPHNSNQFLMNDHPENFLLSIEYGSPEHYYYPSRNLPDFESSPSEDFKSPQDFHEVPDDYDFTVREDSPILEFMQTDFEKVYDDLRLSELYSLTKEELVKEITDMEEKLHRCKKEHKSFPRKRRGFSEMRKEVERLQEANETLKEENQEMIQKLRYHHSCSPVI